MRLLFCLLCLVPRLLSAAEKWEAALGRMPLAPHVSRLQRTNCVTVMLGALQSNDVVKGLIFMPGATDEFYMFRRAEAVLTNDSPTLLDAVTALTNQTLIRATFRAPFLLLHTDEDPLDPIEDIKDPATAERLRKGRFVRHALYNDRDWDSLLFPVQRASGVFLIPERHSMDSFHFYRHSFAAWNLSNWEALEALAFAGKTRFTVERHKVVFEGDIRVLKEPTFDHWPY
jgi:hypothetical protein